MSNIRIESWITILRKMGVEMALKEPLNSPVEAAESLGIVLDDEDKEILETIAQSLRRGDGLTSIQSDVSVRMNILHIPEFATPAGKRRPGKTGGVAPHSQHAHVDKGKFPPWGYMDENLLADIDPPIPLDWELENGNDPTYEQWKAWVNDLVADIRSLIWPQTIATVDSLLDADFALLQALHPSMGLPINSALPTTVQHYDFFAQEDDPNIAFGKGYEAYDDTLPKHVMDNFMTVWTAGIADKVGSLDLQLKNAIQRPRAYQVALIQGRDTFRYRSAATANTPSMVSGHCLQGSLAGCTAFATWGGSMTSNSVEKLQQFTMDIGDRRVFAGVHYPSDNLSSWYTALKLIPHVFVRPTDAWVTAFLWKAIDSRSMVFDAIKKHIDANPNSSPYRKAVDKIKAIAHGQSSAPVGSA
jgi:hypothetical protein